MKYNGRAAGVALGVLRRPGGRGGGPARYFRYLTREDSLGAGVARGAVAWFYF